MADEIRQPSSTPSPILPIRCNDIAAARGVSVRASATRCRCPLEIWSGLRSDPSSRAEAKATVRACITAFFRRHFQDDGTSIADP